MRISIRMKNTLLHEIQQSIKSDKLTKPILNDITYYESSVIALIKYDSIRPF